MTEELFLRDDMIEFSSKLDLQCHNVKAYRKRNTSHTQRQKKVGISCDMMPSQKIQTASNNYIDQNSTRRLSVTSGVRKRSHLTDTTTPGFLKTARTKKITKLEEPQCEEIADTVVNAKQNGFISKYSKQQKQMFGHVGVKSKHLENWLNQVLLQYCQEQKFDLTIELPALKQYSIDRNSLLSKGIAAGNLQRIYKSLFVYSMGFNTLLRDIGARNMNLRKTMWKVYAILLEYCSRGDFQTMIAEIERDKKRKIQAMKEEVQKRQEIIENNQQTYQQKNIKIYKELKQLREENITLINDKAVLTQEFKEAEQAFNQQVSLRLKFQNKINEIHGVHRQLSTKHEKLYDEFQIRNSQLNSFKDKHGKLSEQYIILKADFEALSKKNNDLKDQQKFNGQLVEQMKKQLKAYENKEVDWKKLKTQLTLGCVQREKKVQQVKSQLKNSELMVALREASQKELRKQYDRSLQENRGMVNSMQRNMEQLNQMLLEKRQFGDAHAHIYAELQLAKIKLQKKDQIIKQEKLKSAQSIQKTMEMADQIIVLTSANKKLKQNIEDYNFKILQMKRVKSMFEEQLFESKSREQNISGKITEQQKLLTQQTQTIQKLQNQFRQFVLIKKGLESKVALLTQKLVSEQELNRKKMQKLNQDVSALTISNQQLAQQANQSRQALKQAQTLYEDTMSRLKDALFQKKDLDLRYNQSLVVIQNQGEHIKKLNIKISEVQQRNQQLKKQNKGLQISIAAKQQQNKNLTKINEDMSLKMKLVIQKNTGKVHQMLLEDAQSQLLRKQQHLKKQREHYEKQKDQAGIADLRMKIVKLEYQLKQQTKESQQLLTKKLQEVLQQKKKVQILQEQLQILKSQQTQKTQQEPTSFREKQKRYLQVLKEKTSRIEVLIKQGQIIQDQNNDLLKRLNQAQLNLKQKEKIIASIQNQKVELQIQNKQLLIQKSSVAKQHERIKNRQVQSQSNSQDQRSNQVLVTPRQHQSREKTAQKATQPGWRNDFARKVQHATKYYGK